MRSLPGLHAIVAAACFLAWGELSALALDDDGDGMSDIWEAAQGKALSRSADEDGDGVNNEDEAAAGTSASDRTNFFAVSEMFFVNPETVRLRWPTADGKRYQLFVSHDLGLWNAVGAEVAGNGTTAEVMLPLASTFVTGEIPLVRWTGTNASLAAIKNFAATNRPPNETRILQFVETPQTSPSESYFGQWIRGWLVPPATGNYTFWIAGDDHTELWLSTSRNPANKQLIASGTSYTGYREWTKFAVQQSVPKALVSGSAYYFEAFHREGTGGDHLSVAWTGPTLNAVREVLSGKFVSMSGTSLVQGAEGRGLYFRVEVRDADTDGDGLSDYEERLLGTDRTNAQTIPRTADLATARSMVGAKNTLTAGASAARAYEAGWQSGRFTLFRSGNITPLRVRYTMSGTAQSGVDYAALSGTAVFGVAQKSVEIDVVPFPDALVESAENVTLQVEALPEYEVGNPSRATVLIDDAPDVLYVATLRPDTATRSGGYGTAALRVAGNKVFATYGLSFGNLTAGQTGAELFISTTGQGGQAVWSHANGQIPLLRWEFNAAGGYTREQIVAALENGTLFMRVKSSAHPGGEISGRFVREQGWQEMPVPPAPPVLSGTTLTTGQAARFLMQATYGPTSAEITRLQSMGINAWLTEQFGLAATKHLPYVQARRSELLARSNNEDDGWQGPRQEAWWQHSLQGQDQLRQRMAFALSQIFVASDVGVLEGSHAGLTNYYDMLLEGAFGNFRDLLKKVTLSPIMGQYLSMVRNQKPDITTGAEPDENYAREVMQLFSIGLSMLHPDGSLKLGHEGMPVPTYTQNDIVGLAHIFTGWGSGYDPLAPPSNLNNFFRWSAIDEMRQLMMFPNYHDTGAKQIVGGITVPAGQTGELDLENAMDALFNHPNVGPFIGRQLIQRFVSSNPSPGYIYRVAQVFNNNGEGVRGDMKAVLRAVLTDFEARSEEFYNDRGFGKQREPLLRMSHLLRAMKLSAPLPPDTRLFIDLQYGLTQQAALKSPSVFNFFQPGYIQPGPIAAAGLFAPEFQITSETTVINQINNQHAAIFWGIWTREKNAQGANAYAYLNFDDEVAVLNRAVFTATENRQAMLDLLNVKLLNGRMSAALRQEIMDVYAALPAWYDTTGTRQRERAQLAVFLIFASPGYVIQK